MYVKSNRGKIWHITINEFNTLCGKRVKNWDILTTYCLPESEKLCVKCGKILQSSSSLSKRFGTTSTKTTEEAEIPAPADIRKNPHSF